MSGAQSNPPNVARVVIVPSAGDTPAFDYAVEAALQSQVRPGVRVLVPLGARRAVGIVVALLDASPHPRLKPIAAVLDPQPLLDDTLMRLCRWMAEYYLCTFGEAVSTALPGSVRITVERVAHLVAVPAEIGDTERLAALTPTFSHAGSGTGEGASTVHPGGARITGTPGSVPWCPDGHRPLQAAEERLCAWLLANGPQTTRAIADRFGAPGGRALAALQRRGVVRVEEQLRGGDAPTKHERYYAAALDLDRNAARAWQARRPAQYAVYAYLHQHPLRRARMHEISATFPNAAAKLNALVKAGVVSVVEEEVYRPVFLETTPVDRPVQLTAEQDAAVTAVQRCIGVGFRSFLLWGVTGSGKTEVYLRCIAACLGAGRTVLLLVPEISLTHQVVDRVRARFGERVAVLHSGLSDGERWDEWRRIARDEVAIVVGARSAVFAPLPRLGLVIVDEEHDAAYKQEDGVRYHGRDVAIMRAKLSACPVLLGSATPAMESFHNSGTGRSDLLTLSERVESRPLPNVDIVDLRRSPAAGKSLLVSPQLVAALQANQAAHGQTLVFLNRRGFANFLQCRQCGEPLSCPNCSVTLTLHRRWQALRCHHCEYTVPIPSVCPDCGGLSLSAWGAGTEQVEAVLRKLVPGARVGRMDRDTTRRKGALREIVAAWDRRDYDILIGTQMITKGHDVHGVTLVGVLLADLSLNFPDFRAAERTFQLLTQVAGRAGRGERPGRVIVQTLQPDHVSLQCAQHHDFRRFAAHELAARRELGYPPFARLVQLRCEGLDAAATERVVRALAAHVQAAAAKGVGILGPTPSPLARLRGRHRWQLLVRGTNGVAVRAASRAGRDAVRRAARAADVRVLVDVDPNGML
jgi:primosomal protein N' (replication factor Y)